MVDAGVPQAILEWVRSAIGSKVAFLLALNGFLLVIGGFMHIFSAIVIIVPIIAPLAAATEIHTVHMGSSSWRTSRFGFLMPPVGMNLFMSAYRFEKPFGQVVLSVLPFLLLLLAASSSSPMSRSLRPPLLP
jgi:TRAP-type C4-dicarboxylate transport system permease large subunit